MQIGNIRPQGDAGANVPFSKKFFLGGATSIRGWGRYEVSPLERLGTADRRQQHVRVQRGDPRCRSRGKLGGVLFLDGGNVWAESWSISLGDLRYAVGPGLRYQTPIGPIRFDLGYQLNPIPGLLR